MQAITSLKLTLENEILKQTLEKPLQETLNDTQVLKNIITEITKTYMEKGYSGEVELLLSKESKKKLTEFIKIEVSKKIKDGIKVSDATMISGCKVKLKDEKITFDFSPDAITELLSKYVRPELRSYLFQE